MWLAGIRFKENGGEPTPRTGVPGLVPACPEVSVGLLSAREFLRSLGFSFLKEKPGVCRAWVQGLPSSCRALGTHFKSMKENQQ